jgi:hypothetical protein
VTGLGPSLLDLLSSTLSHGAIHKKGMARGSYSGGKGARSLVTRALMESICFRFCKLLPIDYRPISIAAPYFYILDL